MESVGVSLPKMFNNTYRNRKVFVTGHTGFKGSWLVLWLLKMGAHVVGYALPPPTEPNHHDLLNLSIESSIGDIRDREKLQTCMQSFSPDIVFHLAAQPLVRHSYKDPLTTFETNVMGTVNVLEACRKTESVRAIVNITSDKSYKNTGKSSGYQENDPMGGHDPYSASKGCAELVGACYQQSFFTLNELQKRNHILLASVRAGNIIGGGDWGEDRLIPDVMRAARKNETVFLRNPSSTRPWQHIMDPLAGYLLLGQKLLDGIPEFAGPWNFGPQETDQKTVLDVVRQLQTQWSQINFKIMPDNKNFHEAELLKLNCSKANTRLGWKTIWNDTAMFEKTVEWYSKFYESRLVLSQHQLDEYISEAKRRDVPWVVP
jgi:CDP-glucose 4,6-dehydratase